MSKERLGFNTEREMEHLKKIVNKDESITISSRFAKYLIEQAERAEYNNIWAERVRKYKEQNRCYRESIEKALAECVKDKLYTAENILSKALEESE